MGGGNVHCWYKPEPELQEQNQSFNLEFKTVKILNLGAHMIQKSESITKSCFYLIISQNALLCM